MTRHETVDQSIPLDDLDCGKWYRLWLPIGVTFEGQFLGLDGHFALLREEGSLRAEPWPTTLLARSRIIRMPTPVEILRMEFESIHEARDRLDAADNQQPRPHRDLRLLLGLLVASLVGSIALFLYVFPFGR